MGRLMKFFHTLGAIGLMGAMAALLVLLSLAPPPENLSEYALVRSIMDRIARWIFLPSLVLTLIAGLLSLAINRSYQNAGWALTKLATGIIVFEWGFVAVQGPIQNEATLAARALAGTADPALLASHIDAEWNSLWVLIAVALVNVALGIWRPRFRWFRYKTS